VDSWAKTAGRPKGAGGQGWHAQIACALGRDGAGRRGPTGCGMLCGGDGGAPARVARCAPAEGRRTGWCQAKEWSCVACSHQWGMARAQMAVALAAPALMEKGRGFSWMTSMLNNS
jgi:hypothetical protein